MTNDLMAIFRSLQGSLLAHQPHLDVVAQPSDGPSVPVSLLTGFLGAGKSTLLASLLTNPPDAMVVKALVNDVGQLPLDPTLVANDDQLEVELANGCGCCENTGDVARALRRLTDSGPDLLVLETSGLSDPFALAQVVEADPKLMLDRIVAVVDALIVTEQLAHPELAPIVERQLEAAHVVVVSRADLVPVDGLAETIDHLAALAPGRTIVSSRLDAPNIEVLVPGASRGAALPVDSAPPEHRLVTITARQSSRLARPNLEQVLASLPTSVVRCKGRVAIPQGDVLIQAAGSGWDVRDVEHPSAASANQPGAITVVGTDEAEVRSVLERLGCEVGSDLNLVDHASP